MGRSQYSRPCDKERRPRSYRFVPFCFLIQTIMVGLLACGCQQHHGGGGHEGRLSETDKAAPIVPTDVVKPLAEFNRGAALLEQYKYARAVEKFQSVLTAFPAWTAARFNLGLALLNLPDAPDALDRAEAEFERVYRHGTRSSLGPFLSGRALPAQGGFRQGPGPFRQGPRE